MKNYFNKNISKFVLLIFLYEGLKIISGFPYASLVLDSKNIFLLIWIASITIFHLDSRYTAGIGILCLIIAVILFQLGLSSYAMIFGEIMYIMFFITLIQILLSKWQKK